MKSSTATGTDVVSGTIEGLEPGVFVNVFADLNGPDGSKAQFEDSDGDWGQSGGIWLASAEPQFLDNSYDYVQADENGVATFEFTVEALSVGEYEVELWAYVDGLDYYIDDVALPLKVEVKADKPDGGSSEGSGSSTLPKTGATILLALGLGGAAVGSGALLRRRFK